MDDKENKILLKINDIIKINKKLNINKRLYINSYIYILLFIFIFLFLIFIIIILLKENKNLKIIKYYLDNNIKENLLKNIKNQFGSNYTIIKRLFNYKEDNLENITKNQIHIAFSLDNKLIYPTLVSMLSGLENNDQNKNIIIYHLLLSYNFNKSNIEIFESLKEKYDVRINYFIIPNLFPLKTWTSGTNCIYYKVLLPLMFPDLKRIIHLDGDTLIRKDILEMYNYPFNDNYILGFPFYMPYVMDKFGINATHYITVGCILYNIEKIYNDKKDVDLLQFTIKYNNKLSFPEQDAINYIFYPNIGFLPLKYGIYMIGSNIAFKSIISRTRSFVNLTEGYEAVRDPSIIHFSCCWPKVWSNGTKNLFRDKNICLRYQKEFYYYANKTNYYSIIYDSLFYENKNKNKTI